MKFTAVHGGFTDASWITSSTENKSTLGWIFTLGVAVIGWPSKKKTYISHSTMEAEFVALTATCKEA